MIVDIIKRTALIEVRTGPMGRAGERGIQGQQGVAGQQGQQGVPGPQGIAGTTSWIGLTDKPATFPPSAHTHSAADITTGALAIANGGTGSTTALAARAALGLTLAVDVQPYSNVLDALLPLNVQDTPGDVGTTLQLGSGANYVDDNATTLGGDAGEIRLVGGDAYGDALIQRNGGDAGKLRMVGSDATSVYEGRIAGSIDTSAFGPYRGGNITTAALDGTNRDGGSIDTSAGGSLTMSEHDVAGPTVSGTILTVDGSGAFLTDLNADNITTGTINADRIPGALNGKTLTGIASLNISDGATKDSQMSPSGLSFLDNDSGQIVSIEPPATGSQIFLTWPSATGILLTDNSSLAAAKLTGTIANARLPATMTGLTSVTSTAFVGALTGTASGNLPLTGGVLTGSLTVFNGTNRMVVDTIGNISFPTSSTTAPANSGIGNWVGTLALFGNGGALAATVSNQGMNFGNTMQISFGSNVFIRGPSAATIQLGADHATTATAQTLKAHNVTTGTGANLILSGGTGSVASGNVSITSPTFTSGTSTTAKPTFLVEPTGTTSTGWATSGTLIGANAATAFAGRLLDLQLAGSSKFLVTSTGAAQSAQTQDATIEAAFGCITAPNSGLGFRGATTRIVSGGVVYTEFGPGVRVGQDMPFQWTGVATPVAAGDTSIFRDGVAGGVALRSGTTAHSLRVYNTYTSTTNNELGVLDWKTTTNVLRIGSSKGSGGGSNREVRFIMGDTAKITLDTAGNVIFSGLPTSAPATSGALWCDSANGNVIKMVS